MKKSLLGRSGAARFVFAGLVACVFSLVASGQTVADVDALVQKAIESKAIPAAGVAVVKDGKVVLAKGYGTADVEGALVASENTGFQIASVTKQFTAVATMMLVEEGKLTLSDTLGKHLPDVPAKWSGVTIRQLLNQTSGIPNYTAGGKLVREKSYTTAELLALVKDVQPAFAPAAQWEYSNTNYVLLGTIIEKVSGKSYADFMRDRIFKPIGMTSTVVNASGLKLANAAHGHRLDAGTWKRQIHDDPSQPWSAGAIVSTAADMAKWAIAQGDTKLLKKTSWDEMWAPGKLGNGQAVTYALGWGLGTIGETAHVSHGGGISGFNSFITRFPSENLSVVVLTNAATGRAEPLAMDIAGLYLSKVGTAIAARRAAANAAKNAAPLADTDPETTKFLRAAFEKMVTGEISADLFNADMQRLLFPDRVKELKGPLGGQGAIKAFDLIRSENNAGTKIRRYRITFESGMKLAGNFTIDPEGKISGAGFRPEQ